MKKNLFSTNTRFHATKNRFGQKKKRDPKASFDGIT